MIAFPNAKINIGLNITSKREDGYHNLSSCFLPIEWKDALEIIPANEFEFASSGLPIPGDQSSNLSVLAYELIKDNHQISPVKMHLHKTIPMGAGLGGGSADGAFALKLLNDQFELNLSQAQLEEYALTLGSDCPFFIDNQPKLVTGRGEVMEHVSVDLSGYSIALVSPGIHISTKTAFAGITPQDPGYDLKTILKRPPNEWQGIVVNDFEKTVFGSHPEIQQIKESLLNSGADYASMTGTGSAVYGIFEKGRDLDQVMTRFEQFDTFTFSCPI
ncbi:MAG: 4-(cytidine 5'-diphospho)-2-C-methyl-D-erythritol kinase [Reichenbachiella sp.]|uniref:4-(cytidine 5'-diphospho)-2-C-methyl-D-erythritol kinase n=1 Tax=Reichenbachiella sp. TaxID=2184521 RepID=UPI003262CFC7